MSHGQRHDLLLDVPGQEDFRSRFPSCMGQRALINQAQETTAPKALQIPPQPLIRQSSEVALLEEGTLTLSDGAECLIAGSRVQRGGRVTRKQMELRREEGCLGHRMLLQAEEAGMSRCRRNLCPKRCGDQDAGLSLAFTGSIVQLRIDGWRIYHTQAMILSNR